MDVFVVDATVVIGHLIADPFTPQARALFRQLNKTVILHIPEFCLVECANVLWKRVRFNDMQPAQAETLLKGLTGLPLITTSINPLLPRALQIGLKHQLAVYDSLYIALAESLDCPLITVDSRQETAATAEGIVIKPVTDFPPLN
jgi:predicted nucleic acid-binding protein